MTPPKPLRLSLIERFGLTPTRREALRTTLWLVPTIMVVLTLLFFIFTYSLDKAAQAGNWSLPGWVTSGGPDVARQTLIAIAAAMITTAGVVFSVTTLVLQLASQQFGPRMLRNFIRDIGTQVSLGAYVSTFVYSTLALVAVQSAPAPRFVPHITITLALAQTFTNIAVLIYFIHHVAASIQLSGVVSDIARDFRRTLASLQKEAQRAHSHFRGDGPVPVPTMSEDAGPVYASASGYLQAIGHEQLVEIAAASGAVVRLVHRPGHFLVAGQELAMVSPPEACPAISEALAIAHLIGPNRTMTQDLGFAVDQLVEIAIRALSPAVNDPFTALNCIDWLGDCLCRAVAEPLPDGVYRDYRGIVRVIEPVITLERLVKGATDKVRQDASGQPPILIRQLENFTKLMAAVRTPEQREVVLRHAELVFRNAEESISEPADLADVRTAYDNLVRVADVALARFARAE
jgi:uncharacterized membrane protein